MQFKRNFAAAIAFSLVPAAALAGEQPLYQPAPDWVVPAQLPAPLAAKGGVPAPHFDFQERFEDGEVWAYFDLATRIATPQMLEQNTLLNLPWFPDKGDLIIHELSILRGTETIDLIAGGQKFTVLRREGALEQRQLTGILTATLAAEGLQVGDTFRLRASVTAKDAALGGHVQWASPLIALPMQSSHASMRMLWPKAKPVNWRVLANGVTTSKSEIGKVAALKINLPAPKQPEMPADAPMRFRHPPLVEVSSFGAWRDVSTTMAPLYATGQGIPAGSPLAAEVAAIMTAEQRPLERAVRALRTVQDDIRYLALGMNGGNYVPQSAEKTWSVRFGDCKAKTLLLLAILRAMGIEAEPVLASLSLDDLVSKRLPSAGAFDHVLVRAKIDGEWVWLDGTGSGTRLADIKDSPPFRTVLPVRTEGAELETIAWRAPARADTELTLTIDESASVDLPSVADAELVLRGPKGTMLGLIINQVGEKEKRDLLIMVLTEQLGEGQFDQVSMINNPDDATVTVKGRGVLTTAWYTEDHRRQRKLSRIPALLAFAPDRARAAWSAIPVMTPRPEKVRYRVKLRLPDGGKGFALQGDPQTEIRVAERQVVRSVSMADGVVIIDETLASNGGEVAAAQVPAERDRLAQALAREPKLVAPADTLRRWEITASDPPGATQIRAIGAVFANAIAAAEPDDTSALQSRVNFLQGIGDSKEAIADWSRIVALEPSVENYVARGELALELGNIAAAAADAEAARKLDPSAQDAVSLAAGILARQGKLAEGLALLDERIDVGGEDKPELQLSKAGLIGEFGDPAQALALLDELIAAKPSNPPLLNTRCWIKATREVQIESALKDCTGAIELTNSTAQILDSRAVVWLRLGRFEEALRDIDAALLQVPDLGQSRFVRAIVLKRLGRDAEAERELVLARRLAPTVEKDYAKFGLKP